MISSRLPSSFLTRAAAGSAMAALGLVCNATAAPRISIEGDSAPLVTGTVVAWGDNASGQTNVPARLTDVKAIATGGAHTVALKSDGTLIAWGENAAGQAAVPEGLMDVQAIAAGSSHTVALKSDGSVEAWGLNDHGQSDVPENLNGVRAIAAGDSHTLALRSDGTVVAWGNPYEGATVPGDLGKVKSIAAGSLTSLAVLENGTVQRWGYHWLGLMNVPADLTNVHSVTVGSGHAVALKSDGTLVSWGSNNDGRSSLPPGLIGAQAISAGSFHSAAVRMDGTVVAWGNNSRGQASVPDWLTGVKAVSGGRYHTAALLGESFSFGDHAAGTTTLPSNFTISNTGSTALHIAGVELAGGDSSDFTLDTTGMLDVIPPGGHTTFSITFTVSFEAGGTRHSTVQIHSDDPDRGVFGIALSGSRAFPEISIARSDATPLTTGTVVAWGNNSQGQTAVPPGLEGVQAVTAGDLHMVALKGDDSVVAWGSALDGTTSIPLAARSGVKAVAAGASHTLALRNDGTVVAWGSNKWGQSTVPESLAGVRAIAAGNSHSVALKEDGTLIAWGNNASNQSTIPAGLARVKAIAAGGNHTVALQEDGMVVAWGSNKYGQLTVPGGLSGVRAIAAGDFRTVALKDNGAIVSWGQSYWGLLDSPSGLADVQAIAAGNSHTAAMQNDGTVRTWGYNVLGRLDVPAGLLGARGLAAGYEITAAITHSTVAFGPRQAGTVSPLETFTIRNSGSTVLNISSVEIAGRDASDFIIDTIGTLAAVPVGGETTLTASFAPSAEGHKLAVLRVVNDDPDEGTFEIFLTGSVVPEIAVFAGPGEMIELSSNSGIHAFADTAVGTKSAPRTFSIKNTGTAALSGLSLKMAGAHSGDFTTSGIGATALNPGETADFTVTFAPVSKGQRSAIVLISSNDEDENPFEVKVTGNNPAPDISIDHANVLPLETGKVVALGNGSIEPMAVPPGLGAVKAVSVGNHHALALMGDGTVTGWGNDRDGQATVPLGLTEVAAVEAGWYYSLALKTDGTVIGWGNNGHGQSTPPPELTRVIAISAGVDHGLALKEDGTVVAWGRNHVRQTNVPAGLTGVTAIAAGHHHSLALRNDGTVAVWGGAPYLSPAARAALTDVRAIAGGSGHTIALKNDGTVVMWGSNQFGQEILLTGLTGVVAISAGEAHHIALKSDGTTVMWGKLNFKPLNAPAAPPGVKAVSARAGNTAALVNSPVDFGEGAVGAGRTETFTIKNTGNDVLHVGGLSVAGGAASDFVPRMVGLPASIPVDEEITFNITFTPAARGLRHTTLQIHSDDPDEGIFEVFLTGTGLVPTPLESWRLTHFGTHSNVGTAADYEDFDNDGHVNLLEYAFATNPTASTSSSSYPQVTSASGQLVMTYRRPAGGAAGITYEVELSRDDLGAWSPALLTTSYIQTLTLNDDGTETVVITFKDAPAIRGFVRMRISY